MILFILASIIVGFVSVVVSVLLSPISTTGPCFLITRTMATTKPYDPFTHPRAPLINNYPPTFRVVPKSADRKAIADHGQAPLVIRGFDTPRQVPREENSAARDVAYDGYNQGTIQIIRNTSSVRRHKSSVAVSKRLSPVHNGCPNRFERLLPPKKEQRILQTLRHLASGNSSSSPSSMPKKLSFLEKMLDITERSADSKPASNEEIKSWKSRFRNKFRERPEFEDEFSFETPTKRKQEDHTPPESPKGSLYTPVELLPMPPPMSLSANQIPYESGNESHKRQRLSAATFRNHKVFNPEHTYPNHTPVRAPGKYMRRRISSSDDFIYNGKLQKPPFVEPHPGTPVHLSSSKNCGASDPDPPQENAEQDPEFVADYVEIYDMLPDDDDHKAFASGHQSPSKDKVHWKNKFSYDADENSDCAQMKSRTDSKQSRASTVSTWPSSRAASSVRLRSIGTSTSASSISSNPARDPKMEAVLENVRLSRAAREKAEKQIKSWRDRPIWEDEHKMGSLGDDPI